MPRTPRDACFLLFGVWLALTAIGPLGAPWASAEDPLLSRMESELFRAVNEFRSGQHLRPLQRRDDLDAVARGHSEDMARRHFFSHQNPEGLDWVGRSRAAGIVGFTMLGENVGMTSQNDPNRRILDGWIQSPVHLENLKARAYNATGVGIARATDGTLYYTQLYANFPPK